MVLSRREFLSVDETLNPQMRSGGRRGEVNASGESVLSSFNLSLSSKVLAILSPSTFYLFYGTKM